MNYLQKKNAAGHLCPTTMLYAFTWNFFGRHNCSTPLSVAGQRTSSPASCLLDQRRFKMCQTQDATDIAMIEAENLGQLQMSQTFPSPRQCHASTCGHVQQPSGTQCGSCCFGGFSLPFLFAGACFFPKMRYIISRNDQSLFRPQQKTITLTEHFDLEPRNNDSHKTFYQ